MIWKAFFEFCERKTRNRPFRNKLPVHQFIIQEKAPYSNNADAS